MEWSFKNQFMLKSDISLMSPFPQLSQIKLQLYHNTEWDSARLSETRGTLIIEKQTYSILLKGSRVFKSRVSLPLSIMSFLKSRRKS